MPSLLHIMLETGVAKFDFSKSFTFATSLAIFSSPVRITTVSDFSRAGRWILYYCATWGLS